MVEIPANGSFTGQDIKAVVHLPVNLESAQNIINELEQNRQDLINGLNRLQNAAFQGSIDSQIVRNKQFQIQREITNNELNAVNERIRQYQEFISKGIQPVRTLAELSTISYSIHREKFPVRSLGSVYPKDFTKGPRTIAGTLVFTVFNKHVLSELLNAANAIISTGVAGNSPDQHNVNSPALSDQIPPFDMTITYNNELGESSKMVLYGVEIVNEGQVTSVNDMITENQMEYVARDIDLMSAVGTRNLVNNIGIRARTPKDLANNDKVFQRLLRRRNPFI